MARNFQGNTTPMEYHTAVAPVTTPPFTVMIDMVPRVGGTTNGNVVWSLMNDLSSNWNGHYIHIDNTNIAKANTVDNTVFTASGGVLATDGRRHIITGVWASASSRQCFVDKTQDTVDTTSKTPTDPPS